MTLPQVVYIKPQDGEEKKIIGYACSGCMTLKSFHIGTDGDARNLAEAEQCCAPGVCRFCGEPTEAKPHKAMDYHSKCMRVDMEKKRLEKAEKINEADWDGGCFYNDHWYDNVDEARENFDGPPDEWPEYLTVAEEKHVAPLDASQILESHGEDMQFGDWNPLDNVSVDDLKKALQPFNDEITTIVYYEENLHKVVVLDNTKAAAEYAADNEGNPPC